MNFTQSPKLSAFVRFEMPSQIEVNAVRISTVQSVKAISMLSNRLSLLAYKITPPYSIFCMDYITSFTFSQIRLIVLFILTESIENGIIKQNFRRVENERNG